MKKSKKTKRPEETQTRRPGGKCAVCGSKTIGDEITHYLMQGGGVYTGEVFVIKNVPAYVCSSVWCSTQWIEQTTLRMIDRLIQEATPLHETKAKIYDYRTTGGRIESPWSVVSEKKNKQRSATTETKRK